MKLRLFLSCFITILFSCQKEVIIKDSGSNSGSNPVPPVVEWKESSVDSLVSNLNFINAYAENSILKIVSSSDVYCVLDTLKKKWLSSNVIAISSCSTNQYYLNGKSNAKYGLFVSIKDNCVTISPVNPKIYGQRFSLSDIDPLFQQPLVQESTPEINSSITENGTIYIPVATSRSNTAIVYKIDTQITLQDSSIGQYYPSTISILNKSIVYLPLNGYSGPGVARVAGNIGNSSFFYSNNCGKTFIINDDNSVNVVYNGCLFNIVENNGFVYALDYYYSKLLISSDGGLSWKLYCNISNPKIKALQSFDEKLFCVINRDLFEVTIQNNTITTREINLQGLGYRTISSINKLGSDVYVTTNAGLYSKPYSSFYSYK